MMENLAERRLKREENAGNYAPHPDNGDYADPHPPAPSEEEDDEGEEFDEDEEYDDSQDDSYDEQVRCFVSGIPTTHDCAD